MTHDTGGSLRATLLCWLLLPTMVLLPLNALFTYREGVSVVNAAYDRSLLLSARTIAEIPGASAPSPAKGTIAIGMRCAPAPVISIESCAVAAVAKQSRNAASSFFIG